MKPQRNTFEMKLLHDKMKLKNSFVAVVGDEIAEDGGVKWQSYKDITSKYDPKK